MSFSDFSDHCGVSEWLFKHFVKTAKSALIRFIRPLGSENKRLFEEAGIFPLILIFMSFGIKIA